MTTIFYTTLPIVRVTSMRDMMWQGSTLDSGCGGRARRIGPGLDFLSWGLTPRTRPVGSCRSEVPICAGAVTLTGASAICPFFVS